MKPTNELPDDIAERLEAYYEGELSDTQTADLRRRIDRDGHHRAAARYEAILRRGLHAPAGSDTKGDADLRRTLADLEDGHAKKKSGRRWGPVLVATALLLLAAFAIYYLTSATSAEERVVADNFVWLPRQEATLGAQENAERGLAAYDRQEYGLAYPLLQQGVADGVLDSVNLLYAAVAALGDDKPAPARDLLNELLAGGRYPMETNNVRYYLALAELQLGGRERATELLQANVDEGGEMSERSREVLGLLL